MALWTTEPIVSTDGSMVGAPGCMLNAEMRRRMSRALPSSKNTSWLHGDPPSDVTTRVRVHRIHDLSGGH